MLRFATLLVSLIITSATGRAAGRVYLILWFDTEDYVLPQSNDAVKRLATFLTEQGVRATFRVVGEKARMLEREGRRDVIAALARHDIGFHSNLHSQKPLIDEYEEALDWKTGIQEFKRREGPGFDDVRRVFGQIPTNYCQPGSTWAPQAYGALKQWGMDVYLCDGRQVGLDGRPFWYAGMLNIFGTPETGALRPNIRNRLADSAASDGDWTNLDRVKANFREIHARMSAQPEGGLVSFMFHPYEFITKVDWDIVNFAEGANPPRAEWKLPPLRSPEVSARAFRFFEELIVYMKSFPNTEFITPTQAAVLFADAAQTHSFSATEIARIAARVHSDVEFLTGDEYALAPSETLALLNEFVAHTIRDRVPGPITLGGTPYGPSSRPAELEHNMTTTWSQFSRTVLDVEDYLKENRQVPGAVWLGSRPIPPESYLVALARTVQLLRSTGTPPETVEVGPARVATAKYVTGQDAAWQWIVAPEGVRRPNLIGIAKLQAWTLKPARLGHFEAKNR